MTYLCHSLKTDNHLTKHIGNKMNISKTNTDALNATITVQIAEADYRPSVEKALENMRKNATVPGFRKGMVPAGMIKKQYGVAATVEEVNKLVQTELDNYIRNEKLAIFGQPLPVAQQDIDWANAKDLSFDFEIGIIPEVKVDLAAAKKVTKYTIKVSDEYINDHISSLTKRFGKITDVEKVEKISDVVVKIEAKGEGDELYQPGAYKQGIVVVADIKNAKNFVGKKVGDVVVAQPKDFKSTTRLSQFIGKSADECESFTDELHLTIEKISNVEPHALDQELFDKIYGEGVVKSEEEFRGKIVGEAESAFATETDSQVMNDTVDFLIENTKFDLPLDFLKRWLMATAEKPMSEEEAASEIENSEKGLRYQLIETQILADNNIRIEYNDIAERAKSLIRMQMAQYGQMEMSDDDLAPIVERILKNKEEVSRMQSMIIREKMLSIFKEQIAYKQKEVTLDEFVKAIAKRK